ncbi:hypothetical protein [Vulcaniibacterium tengchongense]|uniref:Uncharacterized protein n=1 Tax=Vulcaniibacterium tengchongense TaxID=1273429 RepID=A0A3N4V752_9GAMM|nr:hypothetical protein [Vulcaniibacterium tengchongense]RPE75519.1 hypothetical protein EDC50_2964 [Vulcaniibacterium tengchongense]
MNAFAASSLLLGACLAGPALAGSCKQVHAEMTEVESTSGCNPGLASCFLGEVEGNHGLRGTTHFAADSARAGPSTSPGFISYSGPFEYRTAGGTLVMRETGVTTNGPEGVVTAYQQIVGATGKYAGASGHFFVSGHKSGGMVATFVNGEICLP